ncbi:MAG TPA: hypothetical protein VJK51_04300 [Candidatus Nanoarchaeia archaeon]|nr:hypothetical protein [Candidatus Nanoarchaeia archaeon]
MKEKKIMYAIQAQHWKAKLARKPLEDSLAFDDGKGIAVVADGVTRDPSVYLPQTRTGLFWQCLLQYPRPSPAARAAELCTQESLQFIQNDWKNNAQDCLDALCSANKRIQMYNESKSIHPETVDYLINDFAGCTAAVSVRDSLKQKVYYGYICDSGVAVVDTRGNLVFKSKDEGPATHDPFIWNDEMRALSWNHPDVRSFVRAWYRNMPHEPHSFGVLTGEENALPYIRTGTISDLYPEYCILTYTDGAAEILFDKGDINGTVADLLREHNWKGLKRLLQKKIKTEGSLVIS